jgi:hypothetical protein
VRWRGRIGTTNRLVLVGIILGFLFAHLLVEVVNVEIHLILKIIHPEHLLSRFPFFKGKESNLMQTTELYTQMVKRERRLWIALGVMGIVWVLTVGLFVAMYASAIGEKSKIIAYTPTGIPKYVEWRPGSGRETIEVQTYAKTMLAKVFSLKYSDFLSRNPADVLLPVKPFFVPDYYQEFIDGLVASKYIQRLMDLRAVTLVSVQDPVEVQATQDGKYWIKATISRQDVTAKGERTHTMTYAMLVRPGDRTEVNPWGLYVEKLYLMQN